MAEGRGTNVAHGGRSPAAGVGGRSRATIVLAVGFAAFLGVIAYLLASSLVARRVETFDPLPAARRGGGGIDTLTVDARAAEEWRFVDLARGVVLTPPDTQDWDLAVRRFHIRAADAMADAGAVPFESVTSPPETGYIRGTAGAEASSAGGPRWYRYSMLTHLLEPSGHVYVVRTRDGRYVKLEMLSYYCTGVQPGCLTFRFQELPSAAASR